MPLFLGIGAGPGMGFETAKRFAKEGFKVVLSARDNVRTGDLAALLRADGYDAVAKPVDAADPSSVSKLVAEVETQHGHVDVLHYNAAALRKATLLEQPTETFNADLATNIGGGLACVKAVAPGMSKRGSGTILMTGGFFALSPNPDFLSLSIGKAGIRAMTLGLFDSLKEQGIHIATVTVAAFVDPGSKEASDVGQEFWKLHSQPKDQWIAETTYAQSATAN
nr:SDR family NAD(P)-dependent oxidoreductase [Aminobacter sp. MSH1]